MKCSSPAAITMPTSRPGCWPRATPGPSSTTWASAARTARSIWMTGTQNHEGIAGTLAAVDYLADLGRRLEGVGSQLLDETGVPSNSSRIRHEIDSRPPGEVPPPRATDRRAALRAAYAAIEAYEWQLLVPLLTGLRELPGVTVHGIIDAVGRISNPSYQRLAE